MGCFRHGRQIVGRRRTRGAYQRGGPPRRAGIANRKVRRPAFIVRDGMPGRGVAGHGEGQGGRTRSRRDHESCDALRDQ